MVTYNNECLKMFTTVTYFYHCACNIFKDLLKTLKETDKIT